MKINKKEVLEALKTVKPGLSSNEVIAQGTAFVFREGRVYTMNEEVCASHPVENLEIEGAIASKPLLAFLNKLPKDEVSLTIKSNELRIKGGRARAGIPLIAEITMPLSQIDNIKKWKPLPDDFSTYIGLAAGAAATDQSMGHLTCVSVDKEGYIVGSDNYRILRVTLDPEQIKFESFLITAHSARIIAALNPHKVSVTDTWVHFTNQVDTIISCRQVVETYPDVSPFMEIEGFQFEFPEKVSSVLDRASIFSQEDITREEEVTFVVKEGQMLIKARSTEGWFEESVKLQYDDEPFKFSIMPYLLQGILKQTDTCTVNENGLLFRGDNWSYVSALIAME